MILDSNDINFSQIVNQRPCVCACVCLGLYPSYRQRYCYYTLQILYIQYIFLALWPQFFNRLLYLLFVINVSSE